MKLIELIIGKKRVDLMVDGYMLLLRLRTFHVVGSLMSNTSGKMGTVHVVQ